MSINVSVTSMQLVLMRSLRALSIMQQFLISRLRLVMAETQVKGHLFFTLCCTLITYLITNLNIFLSEYKLHTQPQFKSIESFILYQTTQSRSCFKHLLSHTFSLATCHMLWFTSILQIFPMSPSIPLIVSIG